MSAARTTFFQRLFSTLILWSLIVGAIVLGQVAGLPRWLSLSGYFAIILFMALVALYEYFRMVELQGSPVFTLTGMICGTLYLAGSFVIQATPGAEGGYDLEMGVLVGLLFIIFSRQMFRPAADRLPLESIAYTVFGLLYIPWLFNFVTKIIFLTPSATDGHPSGQYYLLYLILVTKFSDMGAYVFGSLFGRHPFAPHISPKKTWEGFFGALIASSLGSYWLYWFMPDKLSAFRFEDVTILGLLLSVMAVVGDLAESVIKRSTRAKDSSHMLPGIGGTLDLIDSLLFTAPVMYFYMRWVVGV